MRQLVSGVFNSLCYEHDLDAEDALEVLQYSLATLSVFHDQGTQPKFLSMTEDCAGEKLSDIVGDWIIDNQSPGKRPRFSETVVPYDILVTCVPKKWAGGGEVGGN